MLIRYVIENRSNPNTVTPIPRRLTPNQVGNGTPASLNMMTTLETHKAAITHKTRGGRSSEIPRMCNIDGDTTTRTGVEQCDAHPWFDLLHARLTYAFDYSSPRVFAPRLWECDAEQLTAESLYGM